MGFLRRTFSRRPRSRFGTREGDERDSKLGGEGGGGGGVGAGGAMGNPLLLAHQQQVVHAPAVVTGGAPVHIPAGGTARSVITCRVLLLDGSDVTVDLPVSAIQPETVCKQSVCVTRDCRSRVKWGPRTPRGLRARSAFSWFLVKSCFHLSLVVFLSNCN